MLGKTYVMISHNTGKNLHQSLSIWPIKFNTDKIDIKGRINAIDQIIERNKVTIKEASDALKRSKEEERVVSDELSQTQEIDNKCKSNTLL